MKIPDGWQLVPKEPTPGMLSASKHSTKAANTIEACDRAVYAAMLGAAPPHASELEQALEHLGNVLYYCADIHPDDRCDALDNALKFYNEARPNQRVEPSGTGHFRMLHPLASEPRP